MEKNIIYGAIAIIAVAGIVTVMSMNKTSDITTEGMTLNDFISGKVGNNVSCEFTHEVGENNSITVKTYISGSKVRVDYDMKNPVPGMGEEQKNMHIVSDGEYGYVWGDSFLGSMMQGMKYKMVDVEEEGGSAPTDMIDYDMPVINCSPWMPDQSMFEIPGDIEFMDMDNMQQMMEEQIQSQMNIQMDCSMCDQVPTEEKDSCLAALGCN